MATLYQQLGSAVKGVLHGFDRIVFKGCIKPLMFEDGVSGFLRRKGVLNKNYKSWALRQTKQIIDDAEALTQTVLEQPVKRFKGVGERKEKVAHDEYDIHGSSKGLIGIWSAMESCNTFKARFSPEQTFPAMKRASTKCKHLYYYLDHKDFGFMNIRLQTWFPFNIQIAMNGREWLKRSLEREGICFDAHKNKFLHIDDMEKAQHLMSTQLDTVWPSMLNGFLTTAFPSINTALFPNMSYYWTLWQSEWATDYLFKSCKDLGLIGETMLRQAFMTGTGERVLRYFDRPFTKEGKPYTSNSNEVSSRLLDFQDGLRVRHWVDSNSVKIYSEQNVLRTETTINNPGMFKVFRRKEGETDDTPKVRRPMRKGVADIPLRAKISQEINDRVIEQLADCSSDQTLEAALGTTNKRRIKKGKAIRALEPMGKDKEVLLAMADPAFGINGINNKALREKIKNNLNGMNTKQASAKISRLIRLLRDHGLLRKIPKQNKYRLTIAGRKITTALAAALNASTKQLMEIAA